MPRWLGPPRPGSPPDPVRVSHSCGRSWRCCGGSTARRSAGCGGRGEQSGPGATPGGGRQRMESGGPQSRGGGAAPQVPEAANLLVLTDTKPGLYRLKPARLLTRRRKLLSHLNTLLSLSVMKLVCRTARWQKVHRLAREVRAVEARGLQPRRKKPKPREA